MNLKNPYSKILLFSVLATTITLSLTACTNYTSDSLNNSQTAFEVQTNNHISETVADNTTSYNSILDDSFFDDAVFVGDSISLKLNLFVSAQRKQDSNFMGMAKFLTPGSYGTGNELKQLGADDSVHPSYNGTEMYLADAIHTMRAKKVFIMLGMNDIAIYGINGSVNNMQTVLAQIKEKNPAVNIYVQSATPLVNEAQKGALTNENLSAYNVALKAMCEQNGHTFLDVASVMKNSDGSLIRDYCSDPDGMGVHFTNEGCIAWIEYLRTHIS